MSTVRRDPDLPIACSLTPDQLAARRHELLPGVIRAATECREIGDGVRYSFAPSGEILQSIVQAIEAERHCCQFLRFQLTIEPANGPIRLDVTGPRGTREFLTGLVSDRSDGAIP
jgi:hypothetical protein